MTTFWETSKPSDSWIRKRRSKKICTELRTVEAPANSSRAAMMQVIIAVQLDLLFNNFSTRSPSTQVGAPFASSLTRRSHRARNCIMSMIPRRFKKSNSSSSIRASNSASPFSAVAQLQMRRLTATKVATSPAPTPRDIKAPVPRWMDNAMAEKVSYTSSRKRMIPAEGWWVCSRIS